jgi:hypothetical protein
VQFEFLVPLPRNNNMRGACWMAHSELTLVNAGRADFFVLWLAGEIGDRSHE